MRAAYRLATEVDLAVDGRGPATRDRRNGRTRAHRYGCRRTARSAGGEAQTRRRLLGPKAMFSPLRVEVFGITVRSTACTKGASGCRSTRSPKGKGRRIPAPTGEVEEIFGIRASTGAIPLPAVPGDGEASPSARPLRAVMGGSVNIGCRGLAAKRPTRRPQRAGPRGFARHRYTVPRGQFARGRRARARERGLDGARGTRGGGPLLHGARPADRAVVVRHARAVTALLRGQHLAVRGARCESACVCRATRRASPTRPSSRVRSTTG